MDELLDIAAVAEYLGVSERTVYNHVRSGSLPAAKVGRLWRVRASDLEAWIGAGRARPVVRGRASAPSAGEVLLAQHRVAITEACVRHRVKRLDVFGSILRDDFGPASDVDFLVEFEALDTAGFDHPYWALGEELEAIFGRRIDLVMIDAVKNPYLAAELERTRVVLYAA